MRCHAGRATEAIPIRQYSKTEIYEKVSRNIRAPRPLARLLSISNGATWLNLVAGWQLYSEIGPLHLL